MQLFSFENRSIDEKGLILVKNWLFLLFFIAVSLSGCGTTEESLELKITNINSSLGLFKENPIYQEFGYEITVQNVSLVPVEIDYAEPVILSNVKERMNEADLTLAINAVMEEDDFITLKGNFLFKADDLTKEEISSYKIIAGVMMHLKNGESYFVKTNF